MTCLMKRTLSVRVLSIAEHKMSRGRKQEKNAHPTYHRDLGHVFLLFRMNIDIIAWKPAASAFQLAVPPTTVVSVQHVDNLSCTKGETSRVLLGRGVIVHSKDIIGHRPQRLIEIEASFGTWRSTYRRLACIDTAGDGKGGGRGAGGHGRDNGHGRCIGCATKPAVGLEAGGREGLLQSRCGRRACNWRARCIDVQVRGHNVQL